MPTLSDIKDRDDVYDPQVQEILGEYLTPSSDLSDMENENNRSKAIGAAVTIHADRREIMIGLHNRIKLEPASRSVWVDPKKANGVPIFAREDIGSTKVNHKLHTPFDRTIIGSKASYFVGIPPKLTAPDDEEKTKELEGQLIRTGFTFKINELSQRATGRGTSFVLLSTPPDDDNMYIMLPEEWSCIMIYDTVTERPLYGIRYWFEETEGFGKSETTGGMIAELYDDTEKLVYSGTVDSLVLCEEPIVHAFEGIPLIEFANNTERMGDVELTMSLQDAFDIADSDLSSEISQLRLSYLALLGEAGGDIDDEWLASLKKTGVFSMISGDAKFIEKNLNASAIENEKTDLESRIYKYSNSYNPDELGTDGAMTAYQIRRKLFRLESSTMETESLFRMGLYRLLDILIEFYSMGVDPGDIDVTFARNTPRNVVQDIQDMREAGFNISQKRMSALSPLDINQDLNEQELAEEATLIPLDGSDLPGDSPIVQGGDVAQAAELAKLNGAQIRSANEIITSVADGIIDRDAGLNQLQIFLGLSKEKAELVMGKGDKTVAVRVKKPIVPEEPEE